MATPANNRTGIRVVSRAWQLRAQKESNSGQRYGVPRIAKETGLSPMTINRFLKQGVDMEAYHAAAVLADYFGTTLDGLLSVIKPDVEHSEQKETEETVAA